MATKQNVREVAKKLSEGKIDPNSTTAREILQEIAERVLKETTAEAQSTDRIRSTAA